MKIYTFDFSYDDGNWTFFVASIQNGVLDITGVNGYGQRNPDADWYSGANDDFILEVDFKQDSIGDYGIEISVKLIGDALPIYFYLYGLTDKMYIYYTDDHAEQTFVDDTSWHTAKIRRVGTTYYFSIDGGSEISWDYGTARAVEYIQLAMTGVTGLFDNFKYAWMKEAKKNFMLFYGSKGRGKE